MKFHQTDALSLSHVIPSIEGFKQTEIAAIMDLSVGAVKAHIFQAKEKLRHLLSDPPTEAEA